MDKQLQHIISIIEAAVKRKGTNITRASLDAVGNVSMIRNMKNGKSPRLNNLQKLCDVLDLELYVGLPRKFQEHQNLSEAHHLGETKGEYLHKRKEDDKEKPLKKIKDIIPKSEKLMGAITIGDNDLSPFFFKGDTVFFDPMSPKDITNCGKLVGRVCLFEWGHKLMIRTLRRGDGRGRYNLESLMAGGITLVDTDFHKCYPIRWIRRKV